MWNRIKNARTTFITTIPSVAGADEMLRIHTQKHILNEGTYHEVHGCKIAGVDANLKIKTLYSSGD